SKQKLSLRIRNYDVVNMEFPEEKDLLETNGIIITGSASSAYEDVPWINRLVDFTKLVIDKHQDIKLIGICFGHQIVARAVGGQVIKNSLGWEVGVTEVSLTDVGKKIFKTDNKVLVKSIFVIRFTSKSPIQGMIKGNQVLTVQGHPEFVSEVVKLMTNDRLDKGIFAPEFAHTALEAADDKDDSLLIGQRFIEFMTG
ncbi:28286_t:CDS:2, partial [Racocetra persica]